MMEVNEQHPVRGTAMREWSLSLLTIASLLASACASGGDVAFRRHYVDGAYGQVHVLSSQPVADVERRTPVVCFAPNPAAGRYFRLFMGELGQDRVMHAPDYPGLGQSDPPPGPMDMGGYADAMADTLEALGYGTAGSGRVDVCGYHTGAMVAIELAVRRPDLVRALILAGIPYYDAEGRAVEYDNTVVPKALEDDFDSLRGSWEFTVSNRQEGVAIERGFDNFVDLLMQRFRTHYAYHAVFTYAAEDRAPRVTQPVLILNTHGSLQEETREIAPMFGKPTLIEVPELHHGVFDVGAARLSQLVRDNLD